MEIAINVTDKLCLDLLTTCYEGGSAYWLACMLVRRDEKHNVTKIVGCHDAEDEDTKWGDATLDTMRTGIKRIVDGTVPVRSDIRGAVLRSTVDPDYTGWDAETADCVLQAGLLNAIVYG